MSNQQIIGENVAYFQEEEIGIEDVIARQKNLGFHLLEKWESDDHTMGALMQADETYVLIMFHHESNELDEIFLNQKDLLHLSKINMSLELPHTDQLATDCRDANVEPRKTLTCEMVEEISDNLGIVQGLNARSLSLDLVESLTDLAEHGVTGFHKSYQHTVKLVNLVSLFLSERDILHSITSEGEETFITLVENNNVFGQAYKIDSAEYKVAYYAFNVLWDTLEIMPDKKKQNLAASMGL